MGAGHREAEGLTLGDRVRAALARTDHALRPGTSVSAVTMRAVIVELADLVRVLDQQRHHDPLPKHALPRTS
ncbi:MAG TPA: hypothetical protein VKZ72_07870 [Acidimicrobiales bacterium]|nr:hypothetical protein [Acidimicrobiales bacterium]